MPMLILMASHALQLLGARVQTIGSFISVEIMGEVETNIIMIIIMMVRAGVVILLVGPGTRKVVVNARVWRVGRGQGELGKVKVTTAKASVMLGAKLAVDKVAAINLDRTDINLQVGATVSCGRMVPFSETTGRNGRHTEMEAITKSGTGVIGVTHITTVMSMTMSMMSASLIAKAFTDQKGVVTTSGARASRLQGVIRKISIRTKWRNFFISPSQLRKITNIMRRRGKEI
jgi:hypothetical protein